MLLFIFIFIFTSFTICHSKEIYITVGGGESSCGNEINPCGSLHAGFSFGYQNTSVILSDGIVGFVYKKSIHLQNMDWIKITGSSYKTTFVETDVSQNSSGFSVNGTNNYLNISNLTFVFYCNIENKAGQYAFFHIPSETPSITCTSVKFTMHDNTTAIYQMFVLHTCGAFVFKNCFFEGLQYGNYIHASFCCLDAQNTTPCIVFDNCILNNISSLNHSAVFSNNSGSSTGNITFINSKISNLRSVLSPALYLAPNSDTEYTFENTSILNISNLESMVDGSVFQVTNNIALLKLTGCEFTNIAGGGKGGAVYHSSTVFLSITEVSFTNCSTTLTSEGGGALFFDQGAKFSIINSIFDQCGRFNEGKGGAIFINTNSSENFLFETCTFGLNYAEVGKDIYHNINNYEPLWNSTTNFKLSCTKCSSNCFIQGTLDLTSLFDTCSVDTISEEHHIVNNVLTRSSLNNIFTENIYVNDEEYHTVDDVSTNSSLNNVFTENTYANLEVNLPNDGYIPYVFSQAENNINSVEVRRTIVINGNENVGFFPPTLFVIISPRSSCFSVIDGGNLTINHVDMNIISILISSSVFSFTNGGILVVNYANFLYASLFTTTTTTATHKNTKQIMTNQIYYLSGPIFRSSSGETTFSHVQFHHFLFLSNSVFELTSSGGTGVPTSLLLRNATFENVSSSRDEGRYGLERGYGSCLYIVNRNEEINEETEFKVSLFNVRFVLSVEKPFFLLITNLSSLSASLTINYDVNWPANKQSSIFLHVEQSVDYCSSETPLLDTITQIFPQSFLTLCTGESGTLCTPSSVEDVRQACLEPPPNENNNTDISKPKKKDSTTVPSGVIVVFIIFPIVAIILLIIVIVLIVLIRKQKDVSFDAQEEDNTKKYQI